MKQLLEFFENLNELVYITDMENYEIVYTNKKTREQLGVSSMEEIKGKKCYEVLQGNAAPCKICNNHKLKKGEFLEWRRYNPVLEGQFMLKDTMIEDNGKYYRVELAIDITNQERQNNRLRSYENLEALANEGFQTALQAPNPDASLEILLEYLGKALKGERTYIFEKNAEDGDDNTYEWVAKGITAEKENLQGLPPEVCGNWYRAFDRNKSIIIEDIEDIREKNPAKYENLKRQNIRSLVIVPLYNDKKIIGFYGVDNPPGESLEYAFNMLQIVGHFIVSTLNRRNLLRQLQEMSYCDQLTKLGNRYAVDKYLKELQRSQSMGIVYCDVTGLKKVNDLKGHEAGDELILRSSECLRRVFAEDRIFRIGGDEILVLCAQIGEKALEQKVEELRVDMKEHYVTAAVGTVWRADVAAGDVKALVSVAENRMYEDKAEYYKKTGMDRRK